MKILRKEKYLKVEKRAINIWDLFECLEIYKKIISDEEREGRKGINIFVNVSTGRIPETATARRHGRR